MVRIQCRAERYGGDFARSLDITYVGLIGNQRAPESQGEEIRIVAGGCSVARVVVQLMALKANATSRARKSPTATWQHAGCRLSCVVQSKGLQITMTGGDRWSTDGQSRPVVLVRAQGMDACDCRPWVSRLVLEAKGQVYLMKVRSGNSGWQVRHDAPVSNVNFSGTS